MSMSENVYKILFLGVVATRTHLKLNKENLKERVQGVFIIKITKRIY